VSPTPTQLPYGLTVDWIARLTGPQRRALLDAVQEGGACRDRDRDPEMFFPLSSGAEHAQDAVRVCQGCPMRAACLAYALASATDDGVWGAHTDRQRRPWLRVVLTRRREIAAQAAAEAAA
jgi:WhiB family redox-sensing transcriptional regulator